MTRLLAALLLAFVTPAWADPVVYSLFAEAIFADVPAGEELRYSHLRSGPAAADFRPVTDGRLILSKPKAGPPRLTLTLTAAGRSQDLPDFPVEGGNPVLLVFLESVSRSMASLTGGSPFYIRNRIKDALRDGGVAEAIDQPLQDGTVAGQALSLHPFQTDPNRDRMGEFADLTLRFVVSDSVPGHILSLSADTPQPDNGYHETITLTEIGKDSE